MHYAHYLDTVPLFATLRTLAAQHQLPTYVVGGFVRDMLLGRPSHDIDIVCVGDGIALASAFAATLPHGKCHTFKRYGTAMVRWKEWEVEFVGARKESYSPDSRKPAVAPGSLDDDQRRRDFTINALALSLNPPTYGQLVDPFGGVAHLKECLIKTPLAPGTTFADDPLRMLRAIRFAVQLGFSLHPATAEAIKATAERLTIVSQERITVELGKMICSPAPARAFELLDATGLLQRILPELCSLKGIARRGCHAHKDNFIHTLQVLTNIAKHTDDLWLRWAALLHDIAKPKTKRFDSRVGFTFHGHEELGARMVVPIFRRLRLPLGAKMRYVRKLVRLHLRPIALAQEGVTDAAIRRIMHDAGEDVHDLMTLCRADITSKNDQKVRRYLRNFDLVVAKMEEVIEKDYVRTLQPVIDGDTIMHLFALTPSRTVGMLKAALKEAVLAGEVSNAFEPLYAYLCAVAATHGLTPQVTALPDGTPLP